MTELTFAQSFLSTLSSRPVRLSPSHVEDARNYPSRSAYTLAKLAKPMSKRQKLAPGSERSVTIELKSLRNPPLEITLVQQPLSTDVLALKHVVSEKLGVRTEKVKILLNKKPVGDVKTVGELVGSDGSKGSVEFGVMVVGGVGKGADLKGSSDGAKVAAGSTAEDGLAAEAFWDDLKGFLMQRLKDEVDAELALTVFREAWAKQKS